MNALTHVNPKTQHDDAAKEAKHFLLMGAGVAAIGAVGAVIGGALCPVCVVASPALVGIGAYKAWKARALKTSLR